MYSFIVYIHDASGHIRGCEKSDSRKTYLTWNPVCPGNFSITYYVQVNIPWSYYDLKHLGKVAPGILPTSVSYPHGISHTLRPPRPAPPPWLVPAPDFPKIIVAALMTLTLKL